jgi:hypothetical protein
MNTGGFDLQGLAFLGIAAATAIILAFSVIRLLGGVWNWIFSAGQVRERVRAEAVSAVPLDDVSDPKLTATQILAIKSNLDAVSRQLADLELKLRLRT